MDLVSVGDFIIKAGIPAGIGIVMIWYLLTKLIPNLESTFKTALADQQNTYKEACSKQEAVFERTLTTIREDGKDKLDVVIAGHKDVVSALTQTLQSHHTETVSAIRDTTAATMRHREEEGARTRLALDNLTAKVDALPKAKHQN
jgi:hypothetical protein